MHACMILSLTGQMIRELAKPYDLNFLRKSELIVTSIPYDLSEIGVYERIQESHGDCS